MTDLFGKKMDGWTLRVAKDVPGDRHMDLAKGHGMARFQNGFITFAVGLAESRYELEEIGMKMHKMWTLASNLWKELASDINIFSLGYMEKKLISKDDLFSSLVSYIKGAGIDTNGCHPPLGMPTFPRWSTIFAEEYKPGLAQLRNRMVEARHWTPETHHLFSDKMRMRLRTVLGLILVLSKKEGYFTIRSRIVSNELPRLPRELLFLTFEFIP